MQAVIGTQTPTEDSNSTARTTIIEMRVSGGMVDDGVNLGKIVVSVGSDEVLGDGCRLVGRMDDGVLKAAQMQKNNLIWLIS